MLDTQLCLTLCDPMGCSLPGSSVDRILQARILEWVAILPTQGLNPGLPHCRQILYHLSHLCGDGDGGNAIQTRTRLLILKGSWGLWDGAAYTDMCIWWEFFEWHLRFVYIFKRYQFSSVAQSCLWLFATPWTAARLPCPSPTPGACSNWYPSTQWCHPTISSSVVPFSSCLQSFPASGSFPMSQFFISVVKVLELQHQSFQRIFMTVFL